MDEVSTKEWLERAYKKLKGSVYFDKTQLPLIDQIVEFEADDVDQQLDALVTFLKATPHNVSFGKQHCVKMQITVENPHIFYPRVH